MPRVASSGHGSSHTRSPFWLSACPTAICSTSSRSTRASAPARRYVWVRVPAPGIGVSTRSPGQPSPRWSSIRASWLPPRMWRARSGCRWRVVYRCQVRTSVPRPENQHPRTSSNRIGNPIGCSFGRSARDVCSSLAPRWRCWSRCWYSRTGWWCAPDCSRDCATATCCSRYFLSAFTAWASYRLSTCWRSDA